MYIKPYDRDDFLGLSNGVEFLVLFSGNECTRPINIISINSICIGISGDISFRYNNMESNNNGVYKASDFILVNSVNVNKNELILYENIDGGDSFRFDFGIEIELNILFYQCMTKTETPYKICQFILCIFNLLLEKK